VKGRSSFPQPDQRSLTITIDRGHATKINVQRTWWAYRKSQILCSRTLESSGQSDGDPAIVTNYPKYQHNLYDFRALELVLPSACEFAQDELLSQTANDMQTHVYPKSLEYMPGRTS